MAHSTPNSAPAPAPVPAPAPAPAPAPLPPAAPKPKGPLRCCRRDDPVNVRLAMPHAARYNRDGVQDAIYHVDVLFSRELAAADTSPQPTYCSSSSAALATHPVTLQLDGQQFDGAGGMGLGYALELEGFPSKYIGS
ncbi:hypothetical protein EDB80DRAFT_778486 [Ilyonectria destructans]|nr:hypothetical protein EDB80DRAFT_778486 [Ilyonectria destructans]